MTESCLEGLGGELEFSKREARHTGEEERLSGSGGWGGELFSHIMVTKGDFKEEGFQEDNKKRHYSHQDGK